MALNKKIGLLDDWTIGLLDYWTIGLLDYWMIARKGPTD